MVGEFHMTLLSFYRAKVDERTLDSLILCVMIPPQIPVNSCLAYYRSDCHTDEAKSLAML